MYIIRRVVKTQPGKAMEVARYLTMITQAYEEAGPGRGKAQVYVGGWGLPGVPDVAYAQWTQERIEPIEWGSVPESVWANFAEMQPLLIDYGIEFYELVTPEKLEAMGLGLSSS